MKTIRVAIAGLGVVGSETARLLEERRESFSQKLGVPIELIAVCDRHAGAKARRIGLPPHVRRLTDPKQLLALPDVDIFVELLGSVGPARRLIRTALRQGRGVVTANKRLLALSWDEWQREGRGRLLFEASVAGGIPVLKALEQSLAGDRITAVYGILNGTTNFILTRMSEGMTPAAALKKAQKLGLAEKNHSFDLSGQDTADKVSILASLVTGTWVRPLQVRTQGIQDIELQDIVFAEKVLGRRVKLLGAARFDHHRIEAFVAPVLIPLDHPLAAVKEEFNAVMVRAESAGELMFYGRGAGPGPAASAVLGDVLALAQEISLGGKNTTPPRPQATVSVSDSDCAFYLRLAAQDRPGVLSAVTSILGRLGISMASIHQPESTGRSVPVIITTHPASPGTFGKALREISALPDISRRHTVMRLLP